jgi:NADH/NAD ratio-sensing transcriptional regulator Rex
VLTFSPGAVAGPAQVKLKSVDVTASVENLSFLPAREEAYGD